MTFRAAILFFAFCFAVTGLRAQNAPSAPSPAVTSPSLGMSEQQTEALRADIARMKNLVQQMEINLAFVDTTQSPLKHQFQLEIDMWKIMIIHMEKQLPPVHAH
jgi:hypothetical protein